MKLRILRASFVTCVLIGLPIGTWLFIAGYSDATTTPPGVLHLLALLPFAMLQPLGLILVAVAGSVASGVMLLLMRLGLTRARDWIIASTLSGVLAGYGLPVILAWILERHDLRAGVVWYFMIPSVVCGCVLGWLGWRESARARQSG